jgi:SP family sugar:H+ symporter-like MFS transporter
MLSNTSASTSANKNPEKATWRMIVLSIWVSFAVLIASFDLGYAGIVLIMPSFQTAFGHCHPTHDFQGGTATQCNLTTLQQSLISVTLLFQAVGSATTGLLGYKFGRKTTIQVACVLCVIGAAGMLGTSGSFLNYMVCKSISGVGIGQLLASSMVYGSECVVASKRGLLLGMFNMGLASGNVLAAAVCAGSATLRPDSDWQWKTPIVCQIPLALVLGFGTIMFPESPRWLILKNKKDEARRSFAVFKSMETGSAEVTAQMEDVQQHLDLEQSLSVTTSWVEIYRGANLRRTAISAMILIGLSITGIQFVSLYAALFLSGVGIKNPYLINVILGLCILAGACAGPHALEYGGRRFSLLAGYSLMATCMLILSSVSTGLGADDLTAKNVVVVFLCLWAFVFGGLIGSSTWLSSAEMHSVRLRTYGQANTTFFYEVTGFAASFWTPYMLNPSYGNMGANVGYFYFGVTTVVLILVFLFVPETARLTLEQIDQFFMSGEKAWKTSTKKNAAIARGSSYQAPMVERARLD